MSDVFGQRLVAVMHDLSSLEINDVLRVSVVLTVNDSVMLGPLP